MKFIVLGLMMFLQFNANASEDESEKGDGMDETVTVNEQLARVYDDLYSLDYRKLSIEDFGVYSKSLNTLRDLSKADFCSGSSGGSSNSSAVIVFEDTVVYHTQWGGCNLVTITEDDLKNIESTAIRSCYKEGYTECSIKEEARIVNLETKKANTANATCTVYYDAVVLGKK